MTRGCAGERLGNPVRVVAVTLDAQFQCFQPAQRQPAVERRGDGAYRILQEPDRLERGGIARERRTLDQIGMPRQVLRDAVDDDVGAERKGLLEDGRGERIVDHDQGAMLMGNTGDRRDVGHDQPRVGRRFEPDQPRAAGDCRAHGAKIGRINGVTVRSKPENTRFNNRNVPP